MTLPELEKLTDEMVNDVFKNRNISAATIKKYKIQAEQESKESFEKEQEKLLGWAEFRLKSKFTDLLRDSLLIHFIYRIT